MSPATVSYGASGGQLDTDGGLDLVRPLQPGQQPGAVELAANPGRGSVMFIDDVADEFLHEVFERDDPGRAAVLVDHHGELQAPLLQQINQGSNAMNVVTSTGPSSRLGPASSCGPHRVRPPPA